MNELERKELIASKKEQIKLLEKEILELKQPTSIEMKNDPTVGEIWASIPDELIEYVYLFIGEAVYPSPETLRYGLSPVMPAWWIDLNENQKKVISFLRRRAFSEYLKGKRDVLIQELEDIRRLNYEL